MCVILHMSGIAQYGWSALMDAAMEGKTEVVVELVKAGANMDMQNEVCQYINTHVQYTEPYTILLSELTVKGGCHTS